MSPPPIAGISHIALTVRDLSTSTAWYMDALGLRHAETVRQPGHDLVVLMYDDLDLAINLHAHAANRGEGFAEHHTGLDHVSFLVRDRTALDDWAAHLDRLGVLHEPVVDAEYGSVLVFRDPDGIQLEFFANPPST